MGQEENKNLDMNTVFQGRESVSSMVVRRENWPLALECGSHWCLVRALSVGP